MIRKHDQKTKKTIQALTTLLSLGVLCAPSAMANEGEQFKLDKQPTLLFDGGSGTLTGIANGVRYEIIQGYAVAQGDMVLGRLFADGRLEIPFQKRGLGQSGTFERWPDGIIPYQFHPEITQLQRDRAQQAVSHWNARTTIKLVARNANNADQYEDYINFEPSNGCASWVGRTGGEQAVWLADTCTVGSVIHEIGHAIGLFHEHTRPDRDSFVTVNWENVSSGKELNFEIIEVGAANFSPYDYGSIMHYGEYFFSRNGGASISTPDGVSVGQRDALSAYDISSVDNMYSTDLKLDLSTSSDGDDQRIDFVVSNLGDLGANTLSLTTTLGDDADWLSISADSGWDCQQFDSELRCTRDTLVEKSDSSFSVMVNPNSADISELKVRVESRTLDTDLNNNVFNDEIVVEPANTNSDAPNTGNAQPAGQDLQASGVNTDGGNNNADTGSNNAGVPATGAANPGTPATGQQGGSSGGGSIGYIALLVLLSQRLLRRRVY